MASSRASAEGGNPAHGFLEAVRRQVEGAGAPRHFVGVDLGQARDPTAICVVRRVSQDEPAQAFVAEPKIVYATGSLESQRR